MHGRPIPSIRHGWRSRVLAGAAALGLAAGALFGSPEAHASRVDLSVARNAANESLRPAMSTDVYLEFGDREAETFQLGPETHRAFDHFDAELGRRPARPVAPGTFDAGWTAIGFSWNADRAGNRRRGGMNRGLAPTTDQRQPAVALINHQDINQHDLVELLDSHGTHTALFALALDGELDNSFRLITAPGQADFPEGFVEGSGPLEATESPLGSHPLPNTHPATAPAPLAIWPAAGLLSLLAWRRVRKHRRRPRRTPPFEPATTQRSPSPRRPSFAR